MGLINWIFDIYQHTQIDKARDEAAAARAELNAVRTQNGNGIDAARLERALEELALATKTIQRMLVEKQICTHGEFANKIDEVDAEDGRRDGRTPV